MSKQQWEDFKAVLVVPFLVLVGSAVVVIGTAYVVFLLRGVFG